MRSNKLLRGPSSGVLAFFLYLVFSLFLLSGKGGTGDTWCFREKKTGTLVAIKFIKRPLPKVLLQNIQREFTVRRETHNLSIQRLMLVQKIMSIYFFPRYKRSLGLATGT